MEGNGTEVKTVWKEGTRFEWNERKGSEIETERKMKGNRQKWKGKEINKYNGNLNV